MGKQRSQTFWNYLYRIKTCLYCSQQNKDTSVRVLLNGMHNLSKRYSFPGRFSQLFLKLELYTVEETELCLPVLFLLGKRQGDGLFPVTAEMKGKSWCSHDGHKYNVVCRKGIGYYGFHMCMQIADDEVTDSWSWVGRCQKGQGSLELAHCNPYLWFSNREAKYWSHELKNLVFLACSTVNPWRHLFYHKGD